ncbi:MAG: bifunctional [glutamate--ammonia ligase]-adenylyl-L-tyrosine phosphorylase/[glutamate--ammonia-ligase] adenylyltransferase [Nitrospirota bacterium]|nr:bifunctional [glutamate--ammonia ligase]-adenylyl-L-tyrosine phosphorylase/[glutamate--ammonia-ligase] adenylyltransferase [Nitrospirota bacterium]
MSASQPSAHADSVPGREALARLATLAPGVEMDKELAVCPDPDGALLALAELAGADAEGAGRVLLNPRGRKLLLAVAAAGPFPVGLLTQVPDAAGFLLRCAAGEAFTWPDPAALAADAADFADLQRRLRMLKMAVFLDLAARDLSGVCSLYDATEGLSRLASVALDAAALFCRRELVEKHGDCLRADGSPVPFMVVGMGKLGAEELNYASDIDIITFYGDGGQETDGRRPLTPPEFFARLTHRVVQAVGESTDNGRVFRVDLRLRPEGATGATAWSRAAAMAYYETLGDTWERAAFIKAHPVAGDREAGARLLKEMTPFVFRRYLDFAALEGIRSVKERIRARQRTREALGTDVKLGRGGIREIEFFVQALQLIHAGKQPALRHRRTLDALDALVAEGHVAQADAACLAEHYLFLRNAEHRVQLVAEEQTHLLPVHPAACRRLGVQMGHGGDDPWGGFSVQYREVTDEVHRIVDTLFHEPEAASGTGGVPFEALAAALDQLPEGADLSLLNLQDVAAGRVRLLALGRHIDAAWQTEQGRARWRRLLPLFLADIAGGEDPDMGVAGLECFVESLRGRSIYAAMLAENPHSRVLLSRLFCASRFLSGLLARHPSLLDELLAPRALLTERTVAALEAELAQITHGLGEEEWLDAVRRFKHREVLRVGLTELLTGMDERARSTALARLAEALIRQVLSHSWADMVKRHGLPPAADGGPGQMAVVGMGRIGSGEMGYASDLDLVFIHNGDPGASTPGPRSVTVGEFHARLGRRIVSRLTLPTGEGMLYEVDMRLRPSGASGQLVTSLAAFRRYQQEDAWTWEKQALTRARVVAATGDFGLGVAAALREACYFPRDPVTLAAEVRQMRVKMATHLAAGRDEAVDLKQDDGGIVDIEFVVQYLLLAHGHAHPQVVDSNPRVALGRLADAGLMARADADQLLAAMALYRTVEGLLQRVQGESVRVLARHGDPLPEGRERWFARVQAARERVRDVYRRVLGAAGESREAEK